MYQLNKQEDREPAGLSHSSIHARQAEDRGLVQRISLLPGQQVPLQLQR